MKNVLSKIFLWFAMVVIIVMSAVAFAIPGDILGRQVSFVVLDLLAIFSICVANNFLFRGAWEMLSVRERSVCSWLTLLALCACLFVVFPVFLEQWNIILRVILVAGLNLVAIVSLAITYYLSFRS